MPRKDGIYRAEMGVPPMPDEGAPGPMSQKARLSRLSIGSASDLSDKEFKEFSSRLPDTMLEVPKGKEVGVRKKASEAKSEVYEKALAKGGSASSRADGIAQRGKTRGTIVMCKGGYKK